MIATLARLGWALLVIAALALLLVLRMLVMPLLQRRRPPDAGADSGGLARGPAAATGTASPSSDMLLVAVTVVPGLVLLGMFLVSLPGREQIRRASVLIQPAHEAGHQRIALLDARW